MTSIAYLVFPYRPLPLLPIARNALLDLALWQSRERLMLSTAVVTAADRRTRNAVTWWG